MYNRSRKLEFDEKACSTCTSFCRCLKHYGSIARIHRRMNLRRWLALLLVISLGSMFYLHSIKTERSKMRTFLRSRQFCAAAATGNTTQVDDDLTRWAGRSRVLLISRSTANTVKDITDLLIATRIKYKLSVAGKSLPDLLKVTKSGNKYVLIVFEDIRDLYSLPDYDRDLVNKYCSTYRVSIVGFWPSENEKTTGRSVIDLATNEPIPLAVSTHHQVTDVTVGDHPLLRFLKANKTVPGIALSNLWVKLLSSHRTYQDVLTGRFVDSEPAVAALAVEDHGLLDGIHKVIIGGSDAMKYWVTKLLFLDSVQYLTGGQILLPLTRYLLVDIDDIFVGTARLTRSDVVALMESQNRLRKTVPGFTYNLGFSGKYFKIGTELENEGDEELLRRKEFFWWFPHMWKHLQPHRFDNVSDLSFRMKLNKDFATKHKLPVFNQYSVSPHHSGVYPVHEQLYTAWRSVWDIAVTSSEQYPNHRPARRRRGFVFRGISVLPRQECGLFTKNLYYEEYTGGPERLEASIYGGELFFTFVTNPVLVFMTHMPNYCCDRLAPYTFESVLSLLTCHTNLRFRTVSPLQLAAKYFELFPEEELPVWGNPCDEQKHLEIWSSAKRCNKLPNFVVIGPQKTGSTALYSFLQLHPAILANHQSKQTFEEVQFFKGPNYMLGVDWYMDFFPEANSSQYLFEKSATYFDGDLVPFRVHRLLPNAHIVAIIYPPGRRAYSWYQHMRAHSDATALNYTFKLLIVDGEELKYDPITVMNKLQHYLDIVPFVDYEDKLQFDKKKGFYCQKLGSRRTKCLGKGKGRIYPPLDKETSLWLRSYYRSYNEALIKLLTKLGYSVPSWLREELDS